MATYTLTMTPAVPASATAMVLFDRAIQAMHAHTPLAFFRWDLSATPNVYDYKIRAADARVFNQTYTYTGGPEQPTIATTSGAWTLAEINLHRDIRTQVLALVAQYDLTMLRATFT